FLPDRERLLQRGEGPAAVAVVGVLGEDRQHQLVDRPTVRLVDRLPVHLPQPVADRQHATPCRAAPRFAFALLGGGRRHLLQAAWLTQDYNEGFMSRVLSAIGRWLPKGWADLGRQILILVGVDLIYELGRGLADGSKAVAIHHGEQVISFERSTHT